MRWGQHFLRWELSSWSPNQIWKHLQHDRKDRDTLILRTANEVSLLLNAQSKTPVGLHNDTKARRCLGEDRRDRIAVLWNSESAFRLAQWIGDSVLLLGARTVVNHLQDLRRQRRSAPRQVWRTRCLCS